MYDQQINPIVPQPKAPKQPAQPKTVSIEEWEDMVAEKYKIPKGLWKSISTQESGSKGWDAVSGTGVRGKYQVTQATAKGYSLDRNDPYQQVVAAARTLRDAYDAEGNEPDEKKRWLRSTGRYYYGSGAVDANGNISTKSKDNVSNPAEHLARIAKYWGDFDRQGQQPVTSLTPSPSPTPNQPSPFGKLIEKGYGTAADYPTPAIVPSLADAKNDSERDAIRQSSVGYYNTPSVDDPNSPVGRAPMPWAGTDTDGQGRETGAGMVLHKPAGVAPKPKYAPSKREKDALRVVSAIDASKKRALDLFKQADAASKDLSGIDSGQNTERANALRQQAEASLEQANMYARGAQERFGDLVEVGFGKDSDPNSKRQWAYAKPKSTGTWLAQDQQRLQAHNDRMFQQDRNMDAAKAIRRNENLKRDAAGYIRESEKLAARGETQAAAAFRKQAEDTARYADELAQQDAAKFGAGVSLADGQLRAAHPDTSSAYDQLQANLRRHEDVGSAAQSYRESNPLSQYAQRLSTQYLGDRPDATPEDLREVDIRREAMGMGERTAQTPGLLSDLGARLVRGKLEMIPSAASGIASAADAIYGRLNRFTGNRLPEAAEWSPIVEPIAREFSDIIAPVFPTDPNRDKDFISDVASGLGSAAGFASGAKLLGKAGLATKPAVGVLGVGAGIDEAVKQARAAGFDPAQDPARWERMVAMAGASGLTEIFGVGNMLDKWGLKRAFLKRAIDVAEEGGQEALQTFLGNVNAAYVGAYDQERKYGGKKGLGEDVIKNALVGAIVGGGTQAADIGLQKVQDYPIQQAARAIQAERAPMPGIVPTAAPGPTNIVPIDPRVAQAKQQVAAADVAQPVAEVAAQLGVDPAEAQQVVNQAVAEVEAQTGQIQPEAFPLLPESEKAAIMRKRAGRAPGMRDLLPLEVRLNDDLNTAATLLQSPDAADQKKALKLLNTAVDQIQQSEGYLGEVKAGQGGQKPAATPFSDVKAAIQKRLKAVEDAAKQAKEAEKQSERMAKLEEMNQQLSPKVEAEEYAQAARRQTQQEQQAAKAQKDAAQRATNLEKYAATAVQRGVIPPIDAIQRNLRLTPDEATAFQTSIAGRIEGQPAETDALPQVAPTGQTPFGRSTKAVQPTGQQNLIAAANLSKQNAAEAEQAGNYEAAAAHWNAAHSSLVAAQKQARKSGTPVEIEGIAGDISRAASNRQKARAQASQAAKQANAPTAGLPEAKELRRVENQPAQVSLSQPIESAPLLRPEAQVNPEGGIPEMPEHTFIGRLNRGIAQQEARQAKAKPGKRLITRIAELGGIDLRHAGENQGARDARRVGVFRKKATMSPDILARQLQSEGYNVDPDNLDTLWAAIDRDVSDQERVMNTGEIGRRLAADEAEYNERQQAEAEAAPTGELKADERIAEPTNRLREESDHEGGEVQRYSKPLTGQEVETATPESRRASLREETAKGEFGKLSEFTRKRKDWKGQKEYALAAHPELRELLGLSKMPPYTDPETGTTEAWGAATQETVDALAELGGVSRSSELGVNGLDRAFDAVEARARRQGKKLSEDLKENFRRTRAEYEVKFYEPYQQMHTLNEQVADAYREIEETYAQGQQLSKEQQRRLRRVIIEQGKLEGLTENFLRETLWPSILDAQRFYSEGDARTGVQESAEPVQVAEAAPTTTDRVIQHFQFGEVREAADQSSVGNGNLRVIDGDGKAHEIQHPRTTGNQNAAFVKAQKQTAEESQRGKESVREPEGKAAEDESKSEVKEPWQMTRKEFLDAEQDAQDFRAQYVKDGVTLKSSREYPSETASPPLGTWRIVQDGKWNKYGDSIEQLREIPVSDIRGAEDPKAEGRSADVERYTEWTKAGKAAPPIEAAELVDGKYQIHDGHRRLEAARAAGAKTIRAWVSPSSDTGLREPSGKIIDTNLTHQTAIKQAIAEGKPVPAEVLADYPELQKKSEPAPIKTGDSVTWQSGDKTVSGKVTKVNGAYVTAATADGETITRDKSKFTAIKKVQPEIQKQKLSIQIDTIPVADQLDAKSREIETSFREYLSENFNEAVERYRAKFGKEINTDNVRELSADYSASDEARSNYSPAVHEPASWFAKELYKLSLKESPKTGEQPMVLFTAGGTGAGKTSTLAGSEKLKDAVGLSQIIMDGNLNNAKKAIQKIDQALAAGKSVKIAAVYRDPVEAWRNGVLPRAEKRGRAVPIEIHVRTHTEMYDSLIGLAVHYTSDPRVTMYAIDNTHGAGKAKDSFLDRFTKIDDIVGLRNELRKELENAYAEGKISKRVYEGTLRSGEAENSTGKVQGRQAGSERTGQATQLQHEEQRGRGRRETDETRRVADEQKANIAESAEGRISILEPVKESGRVARGAESTLTIPRTKQDYKIRYEVRELADIQASHDAFTFNKNPNYRLVNDRDYRSPANRIDVEDATKAGALDPRLLLTDDPTATNGPPVIYEGGDVLGGNSRTMMLARVYKNHPADAKRYRDSLKSKASVFGLEPGEIDGFTQPVLVRVVDSSPASLQKLITDLNIQPGKAMTSTEQASARAKSLPPETMKFIGDRLGLEGADGTLAEALTGQKGAIILDRLIRDNVVPSGERNRYLSEQGTLTPQAKNEIEAMLLGRVFADADQMKATPPIIKNKLARVAVQLAKVSGSDWDVTDLMPGAIRAVSASRLSNVGVEMLNQRGSLFGDTEQYSEKELAIADALIRLGPRQIADKFGQYVSGYETAAQGQGLFGNPPTQQEVFDDVFGQIATAEGKKAPKIAEQRDLSTPFANRRELEAFSPPITDDASIEDVISGARAKLKQSQGRSTLYINEQARRLLRAIQAERGYEAGDMRAVSIEPSEAQDIADFIRKDFRDEALAQRDAMYSVARQLDAAARSKQRVNLIAPFGQTLGWIKQSVRHEGFHQAQGRVQKTLADLLPENWLTGHKYGKQIQETLDKAYGVTEGGDIAERPYDAAEHNYEAAAFIASGNYAPFGLTEDQAVEFLGDYFDAVAEYNGADALNNFARLHPAMQKARVRSEQNIRQTEEARSRRQSGVSVTTGTTEQSTGRERSIPEERQERTARVPAWPAKTEGQPARGSVRERIESAPAFRAWFGKSKVVDAEGRPAPVYHGTQSTKEISEIDLTKSASDSHFGPGFYMTDSAEMAAGEGGYATGGQHPRGRVETGTPHAYKLYAKVENPLYTEKPADPQLVRAVFGRSDVNFQEMGFGAKPTNGQMYDQLAKVKGDSKTEANRILQRLGYDGITRLNPATKDSPEHREWMVFKPTQVKSATGNRGTFDPASPKIAEQREIKQSRASFGSIAKEPTGEVLGAGLGGSQEMFGRKPNAAQPASALKIAERRESVFKPGQSTGKNVYDVSLDIYNLKTGENRTRTVKVSAENRPEAQQRAMEQASRSYPSSQYTVKAFDTEKERGNDRYTQLRDFRLSMRKGKQAATEAINKMTTPALREEIKAAVDTARGDGETDIADALLNASYVAYKADRGKRIVEILGTNDNAASYLEGELGDALRLIPSLADRPKVAERKDAVPFTGRYTVKDLAQNATAEYRPARNRPSTVYLNDWGRALLADTIVQVYGKKYSGVSGDLTISASTARNLADEMRGRTSGEFASIAKTLETAADDADANGRDVAIVTHRPGQAISRTKTNVRHETTHAAQSAIDEAVTGAATDLWLDRQPKAKQIREALTARGYIPDTHGYEAVAFTASGEYDALGLSLDDATGLLDSYFRATARKYGVSALEKFGAIDPKLQPTLERAKKDEAGIRRTDTKGTAGNAGRNDSGATIRARQEEQGNLGGGAGVETRRQDTAAEVPAIRRKTREDVENSPEFKRWFGDSKVVDEKGKPLVVYHGTNADFDEFDKSKRRFRNYSFGLHFTTQPSEAGVYATSVKSAALKYKDEAVPGANVRPVYLQAKNPLIIKTNELTASMEADLNRAEIINKLVAAKRAGKPYDSVIIKRERGDEWDGWNVVVFEPNQIKSAIGNRGTFDPDSPRISERKESRASFGSLANEPTGEVLGAELGGFQKMLGRKPNAAQPASALKKVPLPKDFNATAWSEKFYRDAMAAALNKADRADYDAAQTVREKNAVLLGADIDEKHEDKIYDLIDRVNDAADQGDGAAMRKAVQEASRMTREKQSGVRKNIFETIGAGQAAVQLATPGFVGRNILQHASSAIQSGLSDRLASAIDATFSAVTRTPRTIKETGNPVGQTLEGLRNYKQGLKEGWEKHQAGVDLGSGKLIDLEDLPDNKVANAFRELLFFINDLPDAGNYLARYERALKSLVKADERNQTPMTEARMAALTEQAKLEADHASLRDDNFVSHTLKHLKTTLNHITSPVTGTDKFGLGDFIVKYTQVPGALVKRSIEYSPLGLVEAGWRAQRAVRGVGSDFERRNAIQAISRAVTGTGSTLGMGAAMFLMGILVPPEKEDYTSEQLERARGVRGFSVNLSALARLAPSLLSGEGFKAATKMQNGDKLVPIDWVQPWAMGASVGATLAKDWKEGKLSGGSAAKASFRSLSNALEIMGDQSVLKNVREYLRAAKGKTFTEIAGNVTAKFVKSAPQSFAPGITRQIGGVIDPSVRDYRPESRKGIPNALIEGLKRTAAGTLPGLSLRYPEKTDPITGQPMKTAQGERTTAGRILSLLSPQAINEYKADKLRDEIIRLNNYLEEKDINLYVPPLSSAQTKVKGYEEPTSLLRQREAQFAKEFAERGRRLVENPRFAALPDNAKADMLRDVISSIRQKTYRSGTKLETLKPQYKQPARRP